MSLHAGGCLLVGVACLAHVPACCSLPTARPPPSCWRRDMRLLYETLHGPRRCSEKEQERLLVALARADLAVLSAAASKQEADHRLSGARQQLGEAVGLLAAHRAEGAARGKLVALNRSASSSSGGSSSGDSSGSGSASSSGGSFGGQGGQGSGGGCALGSGRVGEEGGALQEAVVAADAAVTGAKAAQKAALQEADEAEKLLRSAQSRLGLCAMGEQEQEHHSALPPALREVGAQLQQAYAKLWRRQFKEGLADMRSAATHCAAALRNATRSGGEAAVAAAANLGTLQRLAQLAADPLFAATRIFAGSVGSTTAAAVMGGLGLVRLGVGLVKFGMQLALFLALLYYLLAARRDPLVLAVGVLPLSESGRQRTAVALNRALGGAMSALRMLAGPGRVGSPPWLAQQRVVVCGCGCGL